MAVVTALITRRKNQITFRKGMSCGETLIGGIIFCGSAEGRERWIHRLNQRHPSRFNYFVCFLDQQSEWALQFGFTPEGSIERPYIIR